MKSVFIATIIVVLLMFSGCSGKLTTDDTTGTSQQRVFTLVELKEYDGKDGRPAYIAVKGVVYDVTNSPHFTNGVHNNCDSTVAGADLTDLFHHFPGVLKKLQVVGTLNY